MFTVRFVAVKQFKECGGKKTKYALKGATSKIIRQREGVVALHLYQNKPVQCA